MSPEASAISREGDRLLHEAVLRIPPAYRLILVLSDMEDLETQEIAKITSLKEGTVRIRLHRARRSSAKSSRKPDFPPGRRSLAGQTSINGSQRNAGRCLPTSRSILINESTR